MGLLEKHKMQKHAYLIIAHSQFEILNYLLRALDDERNDIYIHIDKKVEMPTISDLKTNVFFLEDRLDVRWGDYSQVETELNLFETAYFSQAKLGVEYLYYHLLSGQDLPIKSQNYIHDFFDKNNGKEFLGYFQGDINKELVRKIGIYHLFPSYFSKDANYKLLRVIRAAFSRLQLLSNNGVRNQNLPKVRGTNWCSITNDFVEYLLSKKEYIRKKFRYTFCADEIYKHIICFDSQFYKYLYDSTDEANGCKRYCNWVITEDGESYLPALELNDKESLKNSTALFARKFDEEHLDIVEYVINNLARNDR